MVLRIGGFILVAMLVLVGCQQENNDNALPNKVSENQYEQVKNSNPGEKQNLDNEQLAVHLSNVASSVPNVNGASAIVAGPYAVVGIDVDKDLDRSRVGTIKFSVSEALQHDPYGKTAVVIADADIMQRIESMRTSINEGYPIQGVVDELSAIVGRYMPDFPINEEKPQPDQNKKVIPDEDRDKLDEIEKDQSKEK